MKHLKAIATLFGVTMAGEILNNLLPLPVPAGIYGLFLLLFLLCSGLVKLADVEQVGGVFLDLMPLMFIPPAVGLMDTAPEFMGILFPVAVITVFTTFLVMAVTGKTAQWILKNQKHG